MTDKPTPKEIEDLFVEETGFDIDDFPAAIFDFARAVLAKWGQPSGATEDVENLRKALVYAAFALHGTPQYMLAQGITLIDGDTVRVSRDGWTVEASVNPHRQPALATQPAQAAEPVAWLDPWTGAKVTTDYDAYGKHGIPLVRQQPVAREPLTPERVKEIVRGAGYDQCGIPDTERAAFINGLRHGEREHGIKGGQHVS